MLFTKNNIKTQKFFPKFILAFIQQPYKASIMSANHCPYQDPSAALCQTLRCEPAGGTVGTISITSIASAILGGQIPGAHVVNDNVSWEERKTQ